MEKRTIAHFSAAITIPADLAMLTVIVAGFAFVLYAPDGDVLGRITAHGVGLLGVLGIGVVCGVSMLMLIAAQLRQVLFDNRRAVWIDHRELIFLDRRWFAVALGDIATFLRWAEPTIETKCCDGRTSRRQQTNYSFGAAFGIGRDSIGAFARGDFKCAMTILATKANCIKLRESVRCGH